MASVWFIGQANSRTITAAQWAAAGVAGAADTVWNKVNGYSIPAESFTGPQLAILDADGNFDVDAPDGPRPGAVTSAAAGAFPNCPPWVPRESLTGPAASGNDAPTITTGIALDGAFNEQYIISGNTLPNPWPVYAWGVPYSIVGNQYNMKRSDVGVGTVTTYRFMTDANEICWFSYTTGFHQNIFINGKPYASNPFVPGPTASYAPYGMTKLVFPTAAPRLIEVRTTTGFVGVYAKKPYRIWKPAPDPNPKIAVVGDSYVSPTTMQDAAAGAFPSGAYERGPWQNMAADLGLTSLVTDGIGGTGYIAGAGPGTPYSHPNRVAWLQALDPDVIVYHGGGANDRYNAHSNTAIINAAIARFTDARAKHPNAKLVFVEGFAPPSHPFTADYPVIRAGVQAGLNIKGVYYLDVSTTRPPIQGTGYVTAANGSGNSDIYIGSDTAHLTAKGSDYVRRILSDKMKRVLADDGRLDGALIL